MKTITVLGSVLLFTACAADLNSPDSLGESSELIIAQLSDAGDSLVFQSLEGWTDPSEQVFLRFGDVRVPVQSASEVVESEDSLESFSVAYSFVLVDDRLSAALSEANPTLTIELDAAGATTTLAEVSLDSENLVEGGGSTESALTYCENGLELRRRSLSRYYGDRIRMGSYLCHYRGSSSFPSGKRYYHYDCTRCRP